MTDTRADQAAIARAWAAFFNPEGAVAAHVALLENGQTFLAELTKNSHDPAAAGLSSRVTTSVVTGDAATVTYNLYGKGGVVLLKGASGQAVRVDGVWKVSTFTYCQLISLQGPGPHPGCPS